MDKIEFKKYIIISMLDQSVAQHTVQLTDMKQHGPTSGCYDAQSNRAAIPKASTQGSSTSKRIVLDVPGAQHQAKSSNVPNVQTDMYAPDTCTNNIRMTKATTHLNVCTFHSRDARVLSMFIQ